MTLHLRLVCAVTPLAVAGLRFGRGPVRAYGVIQRPLDQFAEAELRDLFAEPRIDVSVGMETPTGDWAFVPAADILDLARLQQLMSRPAEQPEPGAATARDTLQVIADHHRIELERGRDAAAPGGDDEGDGDKASTDTTGAAPDGDDKFAETGAPDFDSQNDAKAAGTAEEPPAATASPRRPRAKKD